MVAALLLLWRMVRGCGWLNAVLGSQQQANAEEEEEEDEMDEEELFLCSYSRILFKWKLELCLVNQMQLY